MTSFALPYPQTKSTRSRTKDTEEDKELRSMANESNEGTIYQRGPKGQTPEGLSINGVTGAYGTIGASEHVTVHAKGWHRSWDNPGTTNDHSTDHTTGQITQH